MFVRAIFVVPPSLSSRSPGAVQTGRRFLVRYITSAKMGSQMTPLALSLSLHIPASPPSSLRAAARDIKGKSNLCLFSALKSSSPFIFFEKKTKKENKPFRTNPEGGKTIYYTRDDIIKVCEIRYTSTRFACAFSKMDAFKLLSLEKMLLNNFLTYVAHWWITLGKLL